MTLLLFAATTSGFARAGVAGEENCRVILADLRETERVEWSGPCADGFAHGNGVLLRFIKKRQIGSFEGILNRGELSEGYEKTPGGNQYEGRYEHGLPDGPGTFANRAGDTYSGNWKAGRRHGKGTLTLAIGGDFSGEWENNHPIGTGTIHYAGGMRTESNVSMPVNSVSAAEDERFFLKANESDTATEYSLPFDKGWSELSQAQQAKMRRAYRLLHPDDEPPYPEHGIGAVTEIMRQWQSLALVDSSLIFHVLVDASGNPKSVTFISSPYPKMNELTMLLVARMKFKPAMCGGVPCEMKYPFCFSFVTE